MAVPLPDEQIHDAIQSELYKCSVEQCEVFEQYRRYTDAMILLWACRGRRDK